ncbi:MAG: hypothetical protein ACYDBQ_10790 [Thermoplasmatota archaeon]
MANWISLVRLVVVAGVAALSLTLVVLAGRARRRTGNRKLTYVAAAFALFFVKSALTSYGLWLAYRAVPVNPGSPLAHGNLELVNSVLDLGIVALLFAPFLWRS